MLEGESEGIESAQWTERRGVRFEDLLPLNADLSLCIRAIINDNGMVEMWRYAGRLLSRIDRERDGGVGLQASGGDIHNIFILTLRPEDVPAALLEDRAIS